MGTRPTITVNPTGIFRITNNSLAMTNPANLLGPADGSLMSQVASGTFTGQSDVYRLTFNLPTSQAGAIIDGFEYTLHWVRAIGVPDGAPGNDLVGWELRPVDQFGIVRGSAENVHEFGSVAATAGSSYYVTPIGPDNISLFGAGSGHPGLNCNTFAQFGGLTINLQRLTSTPGSFSAEIDALDLKVHYTPVDEGARFVVGNPTAVAAVSAATLGLPLGPGETERSWTSASNALAIDANRASCSGVAALEISAVSSTNPVQITTSGAHGLSTGDKVFTVHPTLPEQEWTITRISDTVFSVPWDFSAASPDQSGSVIVTEIGGVDAAGVTPFLEYDLPAGFLAALPAGDPNELRLVWRGRCQVQTFATAPINDYVAHVRVHDLVFLNAANEVIARLAADDGAADKYANLTYKIGQWGATSTSGERDRAIVLDLKGVPRAALEPLVGQAVSVAVRFAMPVFADGTSATVHVSGIVQVSMSFGEAEGAGVESEGAVNMSSRDRAGERVLAAVSVAQPSEPSSRVLKLENREISAAVEAIAPGWRYVDISATGPARPTCGRIGLIAASDAEDGAAAPVEIYGVRPGETGVVVLESLGSATFTFPDPIGSADSVTGVTAASVVVSDPSVSKLSGSSLKAQNERPAGVGVLNLGERYIGLALRCGNGTAGSGKSVYPTWQPIWE